MEGLSPWLQQVQVTPPAPLSPLSQPELGKQHLQGEGRPDDDEALNSSSRARGVHISQNTSVGSSVGRERPRGSCRRTWLIDPRAADGCVPARAGLWARSPTGTQTQVSRSTDNGLLGKSLAKHRFSQQGSVGASPSPTAAPTLGRGAQRGGLKHCFDSELAHKRHYSPCRLRFYPAQQHISLSSGTARSWTLPPFVIVCNTMPAQKNTSIKHTSIRKENVITWNSPL